MKRKKNDGNADRRPEEKGRGVVFRVRTAGTLLPFLFSQYPETGRNSVKGMLRDRCVSVNGLPVTRFDHPLVPGDSVAVDRELRVRLPKTENLRRLRIVYEDDAIIVVDKDARLLSIADEKGSAETAYSLLYAHVKESHPGGRVFIVHRLDRDTSGLLLFARSYEIQQKLQNDWKNMVTERLYTAVVEGTMDRDSGTIRSFLAENGALRMYSTGDPTKGREAVTHFKTLKRGTDYSLLELRLETGRKNQIRIQLSDEHHPVAGDEKYGAKSDPIRRLALHASKLSFTHPVTGKHLTFSSPAPDSFQRLCRGKAAQAETGKIPGKNRSAGPNEIRRGSKTGLPQDKHRSGGRDEVFGGSDGGARRDEKRAIGRDGRHKGTDETGTGRKQGGRRSGKSNGKPGGRSGR